MIPLNTVRAFYIKENMEQEEVYQRNVNGTMFDIRGFNSSQYLFYQLVRLKNSQLEVV